MNETKRPFHWRSLKALEASEALQGAAQDEFPEDAVQEPSALSRRRFLQLMGASVALAGMSGCRWPRENILPYAHRAPGEIPGETTSFATAFELGGVAHGILATSFDGRPIKVDGNPSLTGSGAAGAIVQASVLELYDPDRSQSVLKDGEASNWTEFKGFVGDYFRKLKRRGGDGFYILSEYSSSPSLAREKAELLAKYPKASWHEYEPLSRGTITEGLEKIYGAKLRPLMNLERAEVIVSFDDDLLGDHPGSIEHNRDFARGRRAENGRMNRLYVLEPDFSLTGGMSDHRLSLKASQIHSFVYELREAISGGGGHGHWSGDPYFKALKRDLLAHRGKVVLSAGTRQSVEVHALVALMNEELGAVGSTIRYIKEVVGPAESESLQELSSAMSQGKVKTLLLLGGNPAYDVPSDIPFLEQFANVEQSVHLSLYRNETSTLCNWHLPRSHYLETWGDSLAWDGSYCTTQPLIQPLYESLSSLELLSLLRNAKMTGHDIVRATLSDRQPGADFEKLWRKTLHAGVVKAQASGPAAPALRGSVPENMEPPQATDGLELVFSSDPKIYDGRFANNSWLQELPDPVSKLTWDNAAVMCPSTAEKIGAKDERLVILKVDGRELSMPALIQPGIAEDCIIVNLGYGRIAAGRVGDGVGFNTYSLRSETSMGFATGLTAEATRKKYALAMTQDHWLIDAVGFKERARRVPSIVREGSLSEFESDPHFATHRVHHPPLISLWKEIEYEGNRWGMAIDLSACTGCSACTVACQAENNIPVVGKKEVRRGREMSWIRLDRYYSGEPENPGMVQQPVACSHCELAPCEGVCPVGATAHSDEGLNDMAYNRCIGTRYCANNCPFKVRRFNWFDWQKEIGESEALVYNPDVTVRGRGVMEKCSYCVQRIEGAKIRAKNEGRALVDGDITPACAQTCPAEAIVFGDLNDPESRVWKQHENARSYSLMGELNLKARTAYLARLKNPNPELVEDSVEHGHHG
jgi:MoCo/4Fe-4S cofactor protein with predicted Tat translocation signal